MLPIFANSEYFSSLQILLRLLAIVEHNEFAKLRLRHKDLNLRATIRVYALVAPVDLGDDLRFDVMLALAGQRRRQQLFAQLHQVEHDVTNRPEDFHLLVLV